MNLRLAGMCLLVVLLLSGCSHIGIPHTERMLQSIDLPPSGVLRIRNVQGDITVEPWTQTHISLQVVQQSRFRGATLDFPAVFIDEDGVLIIEYEGEPEHVQSKHLIIRVPRHTQVLEATTTLGNISIEGTTGDTRVHSSLGSINLRNIYGYVSARSSNGSIMISRVQGIDELRTSLGSIRADVPRIRQDTLIRSSNGLVRVYLGSRFFGHVQAESSSGRVRLRGDQLVVADQTQRQLLGHRGEGDHTLRIEAGRGNINVYAE